MTAMPEHEFEREVRRVFRRFVEPQCHAKRMNDAEFGLFVPRNAWRKPVLRIGDGLWTLFERRDLVRAEHETASSTIWYPSEAGHAYWRRLHAAADPFRAQHQLQGRRTISLDGATFVAGTNETETTLGWLARRKGVGGKPLVSEIQVEAGERLRRDFTLSRLEPRVTADWSMASGADGGGRRFRDPAEATDRALAARERFARAIGAVGTGLSGVLVEVCCNQRGLEEIERGFGWPQRAAKVVLQIALDRLAAHYRMDRPPR